MEATMSSRTNASMPVIVTGFGATACMWAIGYAGRLPAVAIPSWLLLTSFVVLMAVGGWIAGFYAGGWKSGAWTGLLVAFLNLAVLGGLLAGDKPHTMRPTAGWWLPGFLAFGAAIGAVGASISVASRREDRAPVDWTYIFAVVAACATLMMLVIGGLVTSHGAGLAVADWPNTFGYNMFLYPFSRMTGDIYYEHAHRLFGTLVGLTVLVFSARLAWVDKRLWVRLFAVVAVLLVGTQGVIGGLRVTGSFTMSDLRRDMAPNTELAVLHGVVAQWFFALMSALAVVVSPRWRSDAPPVSSTHAASDRILSSALVGLIALQIVMGSIVRHLHEGMRAHIAVAAIVAVFALICGARALGLYGSAPIVRRAGMVLLSLAAIQLALGIGSYVISTSSAVSPISNARIAVTTAHQTGGALLLGCAVALSLLHRRWVQPEH